MNSRQLKAFICVAECGSFSKAEEILYLSKQAIIKQMNLLEEEVGVPLILRSPQGVCLTPAGKVFLEGAKNADALLDKIVRDSKMGERYQPLRLALGQNYEESPLTEILRLFTERFPEIPVEYVPVDYPNYLEAVADGRLSLCSYPYHPEAEDVRFQYLHLHYEELWCLMEQGNPLSGKKRIYPEALLGHRVAVGDQYWAGKIMEYYRDSVKLDIRVIPPTATAYWEACQGCGVGICNKWKKDHLPSLIARPFCSELKFSNGILTRREAAEEVQLFIHVAMEWMEER